MSQFQINWLDETKTVTYYDLNGPWTWSDILEIRREKMDMIDSVKHRVHHVVNITYDLIPPQSLINAKLASDIFHPREGLNIYIGKSMGLESVVSIVPQVYGKSSFVERTRFVQTIEGAMKEIQKFENQNPLQSPN